MAENESQEPEESTPEVNEEVASKVWSVNIQLRTVATVNPRAVGVDADPMEVTASAVTEMVSSVITERGLAHIEAIMAEEKPNGWSMIQVSLQPKPTPQPDAEGVKEYVARKKFDDFVDGPPTAEESAPEGYVRGPDGLLRKKKPPRTVRDIVEDVPSADVFDDADQPEPPC